MFAIGCVPDVQANDQRLKDAKEYLQSLPKVTSADSLTDKKRYDLVVVVITVSRERTLPDEDRHQTYNLGYLTQTVARLLQILHARDAVTFPHRKLVVCNVDPHPQSFAEALKLSSYVHVVSRYLNSSVEWHHMTKNVFEREKDDYVYCLQAASSFLSTYYLVLEDDVLLDESALETVYFLMRYIDLFSTADWLFLKLYYPDKWSGYDRSWKTVVEIYSYSMLGGSLCVIAVLLASKRRKCLPNCQSLPLWFWFAAGAVFVALLCVSIGRQYVESWRQYFISTHQLVVAPGCCTQATLYPAPVISDLCTHLSRVHSDYDFSVDIAIDGFAYIRGLRRYLVQPNVAKHIGMISNLRRNSKIAEHFL